MFPTRSTVPPLYVRFIAANLLAGNQVMDITKFKNDGIGSTSFDDAVGEAVYQNPLILAGTYATQVTESKGRSIGIVKLYSTPDACRHPNVMS